MSKRENASFVFHDAQGQRWPRVKRLFFGVGVLLFLAAILFIHSLLVKPQLRLPASVWKLRAQLLGMDHDLAAEAKAARNTEWAGPIHSVGAFERSRRTLLTTKVAPEKVTLGFYVNERSSFVSLQQAAPTLTHLSPEWLFFKNEECELEIRDQSEVDAIAAANDLKIVPLLTNFYDGWRGDLIEALVVGPTEAQNAFIQSAISKLKKRKDAGITVDMEDVAPEYADAFNAFLISFADQCHKEGLQFFLCIPVGFDVMAFDLDRLAPHVDYFIAMLYHENSRHDAAGPVASQPWFERWLKRLTDFGQPQQWIVGLGAFGCDWPTPGHVGKVLGFSDLMPMAARTEHAKVEWKSSAGNPSFAYSEGDVSHTIWFLDAITAFNQAKAALKANTAGLAVYRLGTEDPKIWQALTMARAGQVTPADLQSLGELKPQDHITHVGEGEIVRAKENVQSGLRVVRQLRDNTLSSTYTSFPTYVTLEHYGHVNPDWIALTFDDGPDKRWTPKILDILKKEQISATFFVVGRNVEENPELVLRMVREGHEIGNHSYTHSNLAAIPEVQVDIELNATQRLLESLIGRGTILFRPPFLADSRPETRNDVLPILRAEKLGYVTICENIDPEDWARPTAETIFQRVREQRGDGSIILLHDSGGDRSQTLEALPKIIHWLRESSHDQVKFVTASQLLDLSKEEVMPRALQKEGMTIATSSMGLSLLHYSEEILWAFMIVSSALVIARSLFIAVLAILQKWRHHRDRKTALVSAPSISIIIAAFNEAKVIGQTIRSVITNGYGGNYEIIVMDDGSRDGTADLIHKEFSSEPRVRLYRQENCGKSAALARLFELARYPYLISLDADTQLAPGALQELVQPFLQDERVGAVSGNAKVGNRGKWLTEFQSLEYTCGFNLDRRAYEILDCITVVPGAIGAYRKIAVEKAGGFTAETLAEDTDLTLHIRKDGWRIAYAEHAVGWTESPETLSTLATQRSRWAYGTLQCLWKHRDALFSFKYGALGFVALPSMWFFQIGLVAAAPIVDILMVFSFLAGNGAQVIFYFALFIVSDMLLAAVALGLDGQNILRALLVAPQRFVYRPLLSYVVWNAIANAGRGALMTWGKLERTATVKPFMAGVSK